MSNPENISPVNPLPPVIVALFLVMIGLEAMFSFGAQGLFGGPGAVGWRSSAIQTYGFNADVFQWMVQNQQYPVEHLARFVTYPFLHGGFTHALFGGAMLLALGKFVGTVFSQWATLVLFLMSSIFGAVIYGLFQPDHPWLIGSFPGVYGLIGGFTFLLWVKLGQMGSQQYRAFSLIGMLVAVQLVFGLLFGATADWLADVGGFAFGFGLSVFLVPGGWRRIHAKLRGR